MTETKKATTLIMVQGGTKSSRYDRERQERRWRSDRARGHQDQLATATRHQDNNATAKLFGMESTSGGAGVSRMSTHSSMNRGTPQLLLQYMNRDGTVRQDCQSNLYQLPNKEYPDNVELAFDMVCPKCLEAGEEQGACQMLIKHGHRKFYIDDRKFGHLATAQIPDPDGNPIVVVLAGTVTTEDIIRCNNGCGWAVRIENSQVWQV